MERMSLSLIFFCLFSLGLQRPTLAAKKSYVVYLGGHSHSHSTKESSLLSEEKVRDSHYELLGSILKSKEKAKDSIYYSYTKHINGFAANLEEEEAHEISKHQGVVSVFPNRGYKLHTTRSWDFLGLERAGIISQKSLWTKARFGEDTIIANLDTGVWPESESFQDEGMGPVPSRWKGICEGGIRCNRKLIGARFFNKGYLSVAGSLNASFDTPRDSDGHGTHTLSTAGGTFVPGANVFGYGNGTAKGGSPHARVAAYKVCWPPVNASECFVVDILAAFDAAIHDGVDVLSLSLGGSPSHYLEDGLAIGAFHAVMNGITVVCSAGNSGPTSGTVTNTAPWILTVGASTMDREFPAYLIYDDHKRLKGESLSPMALPGNKFYPIISSAEAAAPNSSRHDAQLCFLKSLDPEKVKGKIVACLRGINPRVEKGEAVLLAGGAGMVLANDVMNGNEVIADAHVLPATHISYTKGLTLFSYLNSTKSPMGRITLPETKIGTKPAPFMAAFSSQGPNSINPEILKPDITAPGVSVIAAYTEATGPTEMPFDTRRVAFNSVSGTSMSCPHISGTVGLLKTLYPHWSPAAIKSAIMTTANLQDNMKEPILNSSFVKAKPFNFGSGHVWPNHAMNPGLVYDLTTNDYLNFLCALGYNSTSIAKFSIQPYACSSNPPKLEDLNYPAISIPNLLGSMIVTRRLKNVGPPSTYMVHVRPPRGISVSVKPMTLTFEKIGEEKKFEVMFETKGSNFTTDYVFGDLIWTDGLHYVRSPLAVKAKA